MTANSKKIVITTESHEVFVLRDLSRSRAFADCPWCGERVEIVTLDQAVTLSGIGTNELVRRIADNQIHGIETASGHLLVCINSIGLDNGIAAISTDEIEGHQQLVALAASQFDAKRTNI